MDTEGNERLTSVTAVVLVALLALEGVTIGAPRQPRLPCPASCFRSACAA
jgi:hypothetical protein